MKECTRDWEALTNIRQVYFEMFWCDARLYAKLGYEELPNNETTWMIRIFPEREEKQLEKTEMQS